jgi:hypothetical protein
LIQFLHVVGGGSVSRSSFQLLLTP